MCLEFDFTYAMQISSRSVNPLSYFIYILTAIFYFIYFIYFIYRRFNAIVSQLKMHYFSGGAFESLISSQLLKKEKYIWSY